MLNHPVKPFYTLFQFGLMLDAILDSTAVTVTYPPIVRDRLSKLLKFNLGLEHHTSTKAISKDNSYLKASSECKESASQSEQVVDKG